MSLGITKEVEVVSSAMPLGYRNCNRGNKPAGDTSKRESGNRRVFKGKADSWPAGFIEQLKRYSESESEGVDYE